jgi:hypothetical protein
MNFLFEIYWTIKWKIEDALNAIKDKYNNEPFVGEEVVASWADEEIEVKPKKKKAKKKSKNKSKK